MLKINGIMIADVETTLPEQPGYWGISQHKWSSGDVAVYKDYWVTVPIPVVSIPFNNSLEDDNGYVQATHEVGTSYYDDGGVYLRCDGSTEVAYDPPCTPPLIVTAELDITELNDGVIFCIDDDGLMLFMQDSYLVAQSSHLDIAGIHAPTDYTTRSNARMTVGIKVKVDIMVLSQTRPPQFYIDGVKQNDVRYTDFWAGTQFTIGHRVNAGFGPSRHWQGGIKNLIIYKDPSFFEDKWVTYNGERVTHNGLPVTTTGDNMNLMEILSKAELKVDAETSITVPTGSWALFNAWDSVGFSRGAALSIDLPNSGIIVNESGHYSIMVMVNCGFDRTEEMRLLFAVNGTPVNATRFLSEQGRGANKPIDFSWYTINTLNAGDVVTVMVQMESTETEVTVLSANLTMSKEF
jgi:hypothetical protein